MLSTTELTKVMWPRGILPTEISVFLRTTHVTYKWHSLLIILFDRLWAQKVAQIINSISTLITIDNHLDSDDIYLTVAILLPCCHHLDFHTFLQPYFFTSIHPYIYTSLCPYVLTSIRLYVPTSLSSYLVIHYLQHGWMQKPLYWTPHRGQLWNLDNWHTCQILGQRLMRLHSGTYAYWCLFQNSISIWLECSPWSTI